MLDDLYWVMSYSRWKDERFWPLFRDALMRTHPSLTPEGLDKAREYNAQRYYFQGIGRYAPDAAYRRGLKDLQVLADLLPASGYLHGETPTSIDAGIYGFIANIHFYDIDTPLKQFVSAHANLVRHCDAIHAAVTAPPRAEHKSPMIGAASGSMLRHAAPCATLPATGAPMSHVTYRIVRHDEGWAYMVNGVFSEPFPTHDAALAAARTAAAEQRLPGHTETIEYEDEKGHWHTETAAGSDRPDTDVEDTN
jgi:hypothetical protein